jgi:hypothetical protein
MSPKHSSCGNCRGIALVTIAGETVLAIASSVRLGVAKQSESTLRVDETGELLAQRNPADAGLTHQHHQRTLVTEGGLTRRVQAV